MIYHSPQDFTNWDAATRDSYYYLIVQSRPLGRDSLHYQCEIYEGKACNLQKNCLTELILHEDYLMKLASRRLSVFSLHFI